MLTQSTAALFLIATGIILVARFFSLRHRHDRQAQEWSCKPVRHVPIGILGIKGYREVLRAT